MAGLPGGTTDVSDPPGDSGRSVQVTCGSVSVSLFCRLLENGRSLCIRINCGDNLISPCEFERRAGRAATRNWKRSIKYLGAPIGDYIRESAAGKRYCFVVPHVDVLSTPPPSLNADGASSTGTTSLLSSIGSVTPSSAFPLLPPQFHLTLVLILILPWLLNHQLILLASLALLLELSAVLCATKPPLLFLPSGNILIVFIFPKVFFHQLPSSRGLTALSALSHHVALFI